MPFQPALVSIGKRPRPEHDEPNCDHRPAKIAGAAGAAVDSANFRRAIVRCTRRLADANRRLPRPGGSSDPKV